jgi:type IV pilus assembly protein PilM
MSIGIDIGSTGLKVVQVGGLAGRVVVNGAARWVPPAGAPKEDDDTMAAALRAVVSRAPRVPANPVFGVTGRDVNLQYTFMPPVTPQIFRAMMRHELDQIAGPGGSEVYVDYCVTAEPPRKGGREGEYSVVIGRAKRQVVEDRLAIGRRAGLGPADASPNAVALFQAAMASRQSTPDDTTLAVDFGAENLEFVILQGNRLLFARNVSSGARLFTEAIRANLNVPLPEAERIKVKHANLGPSQETESIPGLAGAIRTAAGQLGNVIQSSIAFARVQLKRPDLKVTRCLLSGGGARLRGLQTYLQGALGIPVEWLEPFKHLDLSGLAPDVVKSLQAVPTDMAISLGLALAGSPRGAPVRLSLLPPGQKQGRAQRRRLILTVAAGLLYVLGLAALAAAAFNDRDAAAQKRSQAEGILQRYEARVADFDDVLKKQAFRKAQARLLRNEVVVGRVLLETLARLQRLIPDGMWISGVDLDRLKAVEGPNAGKGVELKIRGQADEGIVKDPYEVLRRIANQLGDPGSGVSAEASQYRASPRPGWYDFEFTIVIPQAVPTAPPSEEDEEAEDAFGEGA